MFDATRPRLQPDPQAKAAPDVLPEVASSALDRVLSDDLDAWEDTDPTRDVRSDPSTWPAWTDEVAFWPVRRPVPATVAIAGVVA